MKHQGFILGSRKVNAIYSSEKRDFFMPKLSSSISFFYKYFRALHDPDCGGGHFHWLDSLWLRTEKRFLIKSQLRPINNPSIYLSHTVKSSTQLFINELYPEQAMLTHNFIYISYKIIIMY